MPTKRTAEKTERRPKIGIHLDPDTHHRLKWYAWHWRCSISNAIDRLIDATEERTGNKDGQPCQSR
jgi:hypothetical protein